MSSLKRLSPNVFRPWEKCSSSQNEGICKQDFGPSDEKNSARKNFSSHGSESPVPDDDGTGKRGSLDTTSRDLTHPSLTKVRKRSGNLDVSESQNLPNQSEEMDRLSSPVLIEDKSSSCLQKKFRRPFLKRPIPVSPVTKNVKTAISPPVEPIGITGKKDPYPSMKINRSVVDPSISRFALPSNPFYRHPNWGFNFTYSNLANSGLLPKLVYLQPALNPLSFLAGSRNPLNGYNPTTPLLSPQWNANSAAAAALLLSSTGGSSQAHNTGERMASNPQLTSLTNRRGDPPSFSPIRTPYPGFRTCQNEDGAQDRKYIFSPRRKHQFFSSNGAEHFFAAKCRSIFKTEAEMNYQREPNADKISPVAEKRKGENVDAVVSVKNESQLESSSLLADCVDGKMDCFESAAGLFGKSREKLKGQLKQPQYKCTYCPKAFPREKTLQTHLRVHTRERPFRCTYPGCEKQFAQSGQLRTHHRLHSGEKPYKCPIKECTQRFTHSNRKCLFHPTECLIKDPVKMTLYDVGSGSFVLTEKEKMWLIWYVKTYCENGGNQSAQRKKFHNVCGDGSASSIKTESCRFENVIPTETLDVQIPCQVEIPMSNLAGNGETFPLSKSPSETLT